MDYFLSLPQNIEQLIHSHPYPTQVLEASGQAMNCSFVITQDKVTVKEIISEVNHLSL